MFQRLGYQYHLIHIFFRFSLTTLHKINQLALKASERLSSVHIQLADDLVVTNPMRIGEAILKVACNGLLLKVNHIGTFTESIQATLDSKVACWGVMVTHHSGTCPDNCNGHGKCHSNGICECENGHTGIDCSTDWRWTRSVAWRSDFG